MALVLTGRGGSSGGGGRWSSGGGGFCGDIHIPKSARGLDFNVIQNCLPPYQLDYRYIQVMFSIM